MEMTSYRAMPQLYEMVVSGKIPKFHLIYIDGWHTFDYTLVDFFYAGVLMCLVMFGVVWWCGFVVLLCCGVVVLWCCGDAVMW
jgi:hypothetical protein